MIAVVLPAFSAAMLLKGGQLPHRPSIEVDYYNVDWTAATYKYDGYVHKVLLN